MKKYNSGPWLVALAAILWAVDAPFRKYVTLDLSSTTIVFIEHLIIALFALPLLLRNLSDLKKMTAKDWLALIAIALGGSALATIFFTQSFSFVSPTVAILLQKTQPFIAILLAAIILKERFTKKFWIYAIIGIFGAYLVSFPGLTISGIEIRDMKGVIFALLAAILWAGGTVFGRLLSSKIKFQTLTALRFLAALFFLFIIEIYMKKLPEVSLASGIDWLFIAIMAILAGFISLFIYYKGLQTTRASVATICELAFPLAAVVVNWIFLGDTLGAVQILGGIILISSVTGLSLMQNKSENPSI